MKITITYPESWAEIKLVDYLRFYHDVKDYVGKEDYMTEALESASHHFFKVPKDLLYQIPQATFNKISTRVFELINQSVDHPLMLSFTLGDTEYGFIPKLDEMSYGEYLDLVSYSKDMWNNMPTILSILYRPITKRKGLEYQIKPYSGTNQDTVDMFEELITMDAVFGATSFFLGLQTDLLNATLTYSMEMLVKDQTPETLAALETLKKNGVDITQLQSFLTMTSQNLIL
jgi:hypothetical protein